MSTTFDVSPDLKTETGHCTIDQLIAALKDLKRRDGVTGDTRVVISPFRTGEMWFSVAGLSINHVEHMPDWRVVELHFFPKLLTDTDLGIVPKN